MRKIVHATYHFSSDDPDKPDESGVRRAITEITNMLAIVLDPMKTVEDRIEARAFAAMTSGFTLDQYAAFRHAIYREIEARKARHQHAAVNSEFSRSVLRDTAGIEARAARLFSALDGFISDAIVVERTGLEVSNTDRRAIEDLGEIHEVDVRRAMGA